MELHGFCRTAGLCLAVSVFIEWACVHTWSSVYTGTLPLTYLSRVPRKGHCLQLGELSLHWENWGYKRQKRSHEAYGLKKIKNWFPKSHGAILTSQSFLFPLSKRGPLYISELRELFHFSVEVHFLYCNAFVVLVTATMQRFFRVTGDIWKGNILNK